MYDILSLVGGKYPSKLIKCIYTTRIRGSITLCLHQPTSCLFHKYRSSPRKSGERFPLRYRHLLPQ